MTQDRPITTAIIDGKLQTLQAGDTLLAVVDRERHRGRISTFGDDPAGKITAFIDGASHTVEAGDTLLTFVDRQRSVSFCSLDRTVRPGIEI